MASRGPKRPIPHQILLAFLDLITVQWEDDDAIRFELYSVTTVAGRKAWAQQLCTGDVAIWIVGFSVRKGEYDPEARGRASVPDPKDEALISQIFPKTGYEPYDAVEWASPHCPVFVCKLEKSEAVGGLGELGLWAKYTLGPNTGKTFLFAIAHFPRRVNNAEGSPTFRIALPQ